VESPETPPEGFQTLYERRDEPTVQALERGDQDAAEALLPAVYDQLRRLARSYLARERGDHTLQPTELVHEAYLQMSGDTEKRWNGRVHFLAVGALAMRHLLIAHARKKGAVRHGGEWQRVTLSEGAVMGNAGNAREVDVLDLNRALDELAELNEQQARIVELRHFGGLTIAEASEVLGVSTTTVEKHWAFAKAWLATRLSRS
jgi:RNA polymerase sigma-70 factor (ECF subfamily)